MSVEDQEKWDARYREGAFAGRTHPARLLAEWLPRLPKGRALDLGCGAGRNALYLAQHGYQVDALDISPVGLGRARQRAEEEGVVVAFVQQDLEDVELATDQYDLIVVIRYLNRVLIPRLADALKPGGVLLTEHHLVFDPARSDQAEVGPKNPAFRMQPGELARLTDALTTDFYHEGLITDPDGRAVALAQFVGHKEPSASR
jgi:SAM-dependent methyltransferase